MLSFKHKDQSLEECIKKDITSRIVITIFLLSVAVLLFTFYEISNSLNSLEQSIASECKTLEDYTIGEVLANNEQSVRFKLDEFNEKDKSKTIKWINTNTIISKSHIRWKFPFSWTFHYPIRSIGENHFGYFIVTGSFFNNREIIHEFSLQILLLLSFAIIIYFLLLPLSKKIPRSLLIDPINNLLSLIKDVSINKPSTSSNYLEVRELESKIIEIMNENKERQREVAFTQIATQVAHDIRSPLAAIDMLSKDIEKLEEDKRHILRNAIGRINAIANNLIVQYKRKDQTPDNTEITEPITDILYNIFLEKSAQYANTNIHFTIHVKENVYGAFVKINGVDFKRVLSNLIDNSVEAIVEKGTISVYLEKNENYIRIEITDNGCGISEEVLPRILKGGISIGKKDGSGLGLSFSIKKIESWNGKYKLESKKGKGTKFTMLLPVISPAGWFMSKLIVLQNSNVIILDDEDFIHKVWTKRFTSINHVKINNFYKAEDLINYEVLKDSSFYLIDYELIGSAFTGLELIQKLRIIQNSVLVTNRYEDLWLRNQCLSLGIKMIPKSFASHIPIELIYGDPELDLNCENNQPLIG